MTSIIQLSKEVLRKEAECILNFQFTDEFEQATRLLNTRSGKIVVCGMGKLLTLGKLFSEKLCSNNIPSLYLDPAAAGHGDLGCLQESDILVCLSNSGETREVLETVDFAKKKNPDLQIVSFTKKGSCLAERSTVAVPMGNNPEVCVLKLSPTSSIAVFHSVLDCVLVCLATMKGLTAQEYYINHHNGYLSKQAIEQLS
jgi:arabinose-5-phosphate isomerase